MRDRPRHKPSTYIKGHKDRRSIGTATHYRKSYVPEGRAEDEVWQVGTDLSLSLSLSHTHTHTHTQLRT
jgi:hypothetical protein